MFLQLNSHISKSLQLQFALGHLEPPHLSDVFFCGVQFPEHIHIVCLVKLLQQLVENSHWDAEVQVWISHFGSQVPGVTGHHTCTTDDEDEQISVEK